MEILPREERKRFERGRFLFLLSFTSITFLIILGRLFYLQIYLGEKYYRKTVENSVKMKVVKAPRGLIMDRNGRILADLRPSFDCTLTAGLVPAGGGKGGEMEGGELHLLSDILHLPQEEIEKKYRFGKRISLFKPFVLKMDLSWEEVSRLEGMNFFLPGTEIRVSRKRTYNLGEIFCHTIGYIGEISREELRRYSGQDPPPYEMGDLIGRAGLEKLMEGYLKGEDGFYYVLKDALGREYDPEREETTDEYLNFLGENIRERRKEAIPGKNVYLTLDSELQTYIHSLFLQKEGVVVALDPGTGEMLASISSPGFDPECFMRGFGKEEWEALVSNPFHPLVDKSIKGQYAPGSCFKPFIALMGLSEGIVSPWTRYYCSGFFRLGRSKFRCWSWKRGGHGWVDLKRAVTVSCDIYFYNLALRLGVERIARYSREFGFGERTGIMPDEEKPGLIPTPAWKRRQFFREWTTGETILVSIGQSYNLVTPVQLAYSFAALVNGGRLYSGSLVKRVEGVESGAGSGGATGVSSGPQIRKRIDVDPKYLDILKGAMRNAVESREGTARAARIPHFPTGGKTGTAQLVKQEIRDLIKGNIPVKDNAWYIGFAPLDTPSLLLVILVERGGSGGVAAAPIARKIFEWYFRDEIKEMWRRASYPPWKRGSAISRAGGREE